jgi:hypothetical protein
MSAMVAALAISAAALAGCGKSAEFSKQEAAQLQQGPPREMPAEARAALLRGQSGPPPNAAPPAGAAGGAAPAGNN